MDEATGSATVAQDVMANTRQSTAKVAIQKPGIYTVQHGDTLWEIAQRYLGDGREHKRIAALNRGRVQPDGRAFRDGNRIYPGWQLVMPADAHTQPHEGEATESAESPSVVVEGGDNLWAIAVDALTKSLPHSPKDDEIVAYWRALMALNRNHLADPNVLHAGQHVYLPPLPNQTPAPAKADHSPVDTARRSIPRQPAQPSAQPTPLPTNEEESPTRPSASQNPGSDVADGVRAVGLLGVAAALLAVGVTHVLRRRRQRRLHLLRTNERPAEPPAELDEIRTALILDADEAQVAQVGAAVRALARDLHEHNSVGSRPRLVQVSTGRTEILLTTPVLPAAPGWRADADGQVWVCETQRDDRAVNSAPASTLITLGLPAPAGQVYLDIEAEGVVSVSGEPGSVTSFARSLVFELAHSPFAAALSLVLVGDAAGDAVPDLARVRQVAAWADVAHEALSWAQQSQSLIANRGFDNAFLAREDGQADDGLASYVLVLNEVPSDESFTQLCELITSGATTVSVVIVGTEQVLGTEIRVTDGLLTMPSLGLICQAQGLGETAGRKIAELLDDAERRSERTPDPTLEIVDAATGSTPDAPIANPSAASQADRETDSCVEPDYNVLVRLLGDIRIEGASAPLTPKQTAVVAYIALHGPVTAERLEDAVWTTPTGARRKRLANTLSECRAVLGADLLPLASGGRYEVGPLIRTDLDLFNFRVAAADRSAPQDAIRHLQAALQLASGPVFTYRTADRASFVWVDLENWTSTWGLRVTEVAQRLADACMEAGDSEGAIAAALAGLATSPTDTGLTEALMRAHGERGERAAVDQVFQSHVTALEELDIDEVAESTLELHAELRRQTAKVG
jgi:DNA-binding SARP family transcriptional activator/LysM repeat protein